MGDQQAFIDDWRHRRAEIRRTLFILLAEIQTPQRLAGFGVECRENSADAEGVQLTVCINRSSLRPFAMTNGRLIHLVRSGILLLPTDFAVRRIEGKSGFLIALPCEFVNAAGSRDRRRVTDPDFSLPLELQLLRPTLRLLKDDRVAMRPAPFRPIRRKE